MPLKKKKKTQLQDSLDVIQLVNVQQWQCDFSTQVRALSFRGGGTCLPLAKLLLKACLRLASNPAPCRNQGAVVLPGSTQQTHTAVHACVVAAE